MLGWLRCFRFKAYNASKFHLLERRDPLSYRVVRAYHMPLEAGWRCLFAFYAFDEIVPGDECALISAFGILERKPALSLFVCVRARAC